MIRDPLMNLMALNMYRAYIMEYYATIDDFIDRPNAMTFDEWTEENKSLFTNL
jgi:hypothetical protein